MSFFQIVVKFLSPMRENPSMFLRSCFQGFIWAAQGVVHVYFIQSIISHIGNKDLPLLNKTLIFYAGYIILYEVLEHISRNWGWIEAVPKTKSLLSKKYIPLFLKIDNNTVESVGTGKLVSIIEKGIDNWTDWLYFMFERGWAFLIIFLYVIFQLSINNLLYTLIFIIMTIIMSILAYIINEKTVIERNKKNEYKALFTKHLVKIIMSKFEILQSNKTEKEVEQLEYYMDQNYRLNMAQGYYLQPYFRIPEFTLSLAKVAICYYMGTQVISGTLSFSGFVGIITSLILMDKALDGFLKIYKDFTKDYPSIEAFWKFFDESKTIPGYDTGNTFRHTHGEIEIKNLSFSYNQNSEIFTSFDLSLQGNKVTALVGPSGGGKTTLAKLIAGYIQPNSGSIIVDNQNLKEVSLKSYYQDIGYLTQEPSVFDGTVLENLTYALEGKVSKSKIQEAIQLACCEFIETLPNGLETHIGERGVKLSGGQKQRLAIAKIILKNPSIIILDEPTSALDSFSEERITEAFQNLFVGRTVIIIAHRLQTVKKADDIIVIDGGKVIERGTHTSLTKRGGYYKKMIDLQSGF